MLLKRACPWAIEKFWDNQGWSQEARNLGQYAYNIFFNLSIFLSRQSPSHCCSFCHRSGADLEAVWLEVTQADGSRPRAGCAGPSCRSHLFLLRQASWEIYLFQNKGTEIMHRRNVNVCVFAAIWTAARIQTSGMRSPRPCQHQLRPEPEHTKNPAVQRMWLQRGRTDWRLCRDHLDLHTWGHCSQSWRLLPLQTSPRHLPDRRHEQERRGS